MAGRKPTGQGRKSKPAGSGRRPVDPETRARLLELAQQTDPTLSRNAIAKELGLSPSTVTRIVAAELPSHTWEREAPRKAIEARQVDLKARRTELAVDTLTEVRRLMGLLTSPHEQTHWDRDGIMHRATIERPTSGDVRNYATAIGILTDKHLALVRMDSDDRDLPAVDRWLLDVMGQAQQTVVAA